MSAFEAIFNSMSEKNKRMFIAGGVSMLTFFLVMTGVIQPADKKIKSYQIQQRDLQEKGPILQEVLGLETRLTEYQKSLSPDRDLSPLMAEISDLAEKAGLENVSTSLEKPPLTEEGDTEKLSILIDGTGSFHQIGGFVSGIESLKRYAKISKVEFGKMSASTGLAAEKPLKAGSKRFTIIVSTFYVPKEAVA